MGESTREEVGRAYSTSGDFITVTPDEDAGVADVAAVDARGDAWATLHLNPGHLEQLRNATDRALEALAGHSAPRPLADDAAYWRQMYEERLLLQEDGFTVLLGERDRYRDALLSLHRTAERLMVDENEDQRGMGCAMAEVTSIVVEDPASHPDRASTSPTTRTGEATETKQTHKRGASS
jgi:hypothetical protein